MKHILTLLCILTTLSLCAQIEGAGDVTYNDEPVPPPPLALHPFTKDFQLVVDIATSPDGEELALVAEHDVLLYRVKERVISGAFPYGYPDQVSKLRNIKPAKVMLFAHDNLHLLTLESDGSVSVRDKRDGEIKRTIAIANHIITSFAYTKKRDHLLIGTNRGAVYICHVNDYEVVKKIEVSNQTISGLASAGDIVLAGDKYGNRYSISVSSGEVKSLAPSLRDEIYSIDISSDGRYGIFGSSNLMLLEDLAEGKVINQLSFQQLYRVSFNPVDNSVLIGYLDGISGYTIEGQQSYRYSERFKTGILFEFIPNSSFMARLIGDNVRGTHDIEIIDMKTQAVVDVIQNTTSAIGKAMFSADGKKFLFTQEKALKSIDMASGTVTNYASVDDIAFTADAKSVTYCQRDPAQPSNLRTWKVMNTNTGTVSFTIPPNDIASVLKSQLLLSVDNKFVGYIYHDKGVPHFGVDDLKGNKVYSLRGWGNGYYQCYEFTPSPKVVLHTAHTYNEGRMRLINIADTTRQLEFADAYKLDYQGNDLLVYDNTLKKVLWINTMTLKVERELPLRYRPSFVSFSKDQKEVAFLYVQSYKKYLNGQIAVYDLKDLKRKHVIFFDTFNTLRITNFLWSPNGKTFVITGDNGLIEFIGVQASKPIAILLAEHYGKNYVLIDDKLRWTGTVHALSYMVQVEKHGIPVKPAELQREKYDALLRSLLLD
jgi:WD40 repeat protein